MEEHVLVQADAVFATLNNSGSDALVQSGFNPDITMKRLLGLCNRLPMHPFILPSSLCVPLTPFGSWRVLMAVGDWKELQPIALTKKANEVVNNSVSSPLEQMDHAKASTFQLKTQYRMSAAIARSPGKNFYEDKLVTHPSLNADNQIRNPSASNFSVDVPNCEFHGEQSGTWIVNRGTTEAVHQLVDNFLEAGIPGDNIVLLCYYKAQTKFFQEKYPQIVNGVV
ncbi:MAG: hypothetical protein LQ350_003180 [Teloschistes chrysophthalmus]|nr:MAG: hypothetical protein LQ350_003180 [Niorma chrysophthalma]